MNGNRRKATFTPAVGSFLPRLTRKAMEKYGFSAAQLITDWVRIVGPELARHSEPQRLKWPRGVDAYGETDSGEAGRPGAILHLRVDPARALDVQYGARQIMERINGYFGYRAVAELRIVQAPIGQNPRAVPQPGPRQIVRPPPSTRANAGRTDASVARTTSLPDLNTVADEQLRASLARLRRAMSQT